MSDPRDLQQHVPDYSYLKEQYRQIHQSPSSVDDFKAMQNGFTGLRFHPAPVIRVELTWKQRWQALNRWQWRQFWYGVRFDIHISSPEGVTIVRSKYAPGREL